MFDHYNVQCPTYTTVYNHDPETFHHWSVEESLRDDSFEIKSLALFLAVILAVDAVDLIMYRFFNEELLTRPRSSSSPRPQGGREYWMEAIMWVGVTGAMVDFVFAIVSEDMEMFVSRGIYLLELWVLQWETRRVLACLRESESRRGEVKNKRESKRKSQDKEKGDEKEKAETEEDEKNSEREMEDDLEDDEYDDDATEEEEDEETAEYEDEDDFSENCDYSFC